MSTEIKPHFIIKNKFQKKSELYSDILTPEILSDVCKLVTGQVEYTYDFVDEVNVGRLATIEYRETITYVSFSETGDIRGRNSSFQSFPSALVRYYKDPKPSKRICFYFLPSPGHFETSYFIFMYRLMVTSGVELLNADKFLTQDIHPFNAIDDVIAARNNNKTRNSGNSPTYLTRSSSSVAQIYGKTYGANKKETTLLCIALSHIETRIQIELYQILEQTLSVLPKPDLEVIQSLGKVKVIPTDLTMEEKEFDKNNSLRSPRFIYNLLDKLGPKKCALCGCEIPELIDGAHIWTVADIKRVPDLSIEEKIEFATDGDNGIWLCENHHKMLDEDLLKITLAGLIEYKPNLEEKSKEYIRNTTPITQFAPVILTQRFVGYLQKRYDMVCAH